ncbi:MAG: Pr6Pr family membrane protein [Candidatus Baltobacteraceae bacterium]
MRQPLNILRTGAALAVAAAIFVQIDAEILKHAFQAWHFFSFFTIESNILGAAILLCAWGYERGGETPPWYALARGATTSFLAVTGIIYWTVLANGPQILIPWVNIVLHAIFPIVVVVDWIVAPSPLDTSLWKSLRWWLAFPLLYCAYSLVRGAFVAWYPYGFLDPRIFGYPTVLFFCIAIALGFTAIDAGIYAIARRRYTGVTS